MRTLNVRLAVILMVACVVFFSGVYFLHGYQVRRNAYVFHEAGLQSLEKAKEAAKANNPIAEQKAYENAIQNLFWYIRLAPDDVDAMEQLGILLAERAQNVRRLLQAFELLERVLRQDPERVEVRRRLVDMSIATRRYQTAKDHLQDYLLKQLPTDADLWGQLGLCNAEMGEYDAAIEKYHKAIGISPKCIEVYPRLASLLRYHFRREKEADEWIDKMTKNNPKSARAHFLRGAYLRSKDDNDNALQEALKSLELEPDNRDGLWLAAQSYLAKADFEKAREYAARSIKLYPNDINLYMVMADIELQAKNREKAIETIQDGLKATEQNPQLLWTLANLMIDDGRLDDARNIIKQLEKTDHPKQLLMYLDARIDFVQGRWLEARKGFEKARGMLTMWPDRCKQVDMWIGQCYGQLGNRDLQLEAYRRALSIDPFYAPARAGIIEVEMAAGDVNEALKEFEQIRKSGKMTTAGLIPLAQMLIAQNLKQPEGERDWAQVENVLDQAEKTNPDALQIPLLRADVLVAQNRMDEAETLLQKAIEKSPKEPRLRAVLISLAGRQKNWEKAEKLVEESQALFGDTVEQRLNRAQYLVQRYGSKSAEELKKLDENTDKFSDDERLALWGGLLNAAMLAEDTAQAKKLCLRIAEKQPNNIQVRYLLFEQALRAQDSEGLDQALKEIEKVAGQGAYWHYGQAVLLSLKAKDQKDPAPLLNKALKHLAEAAESRKSWSRVPLLMAGIYDQQNQTDTALKYYLEAIELGDTNPDAIRRALQLLFQKQDYAAADRLLRQLEKQQTAFSTDMNRATAEIALRQGEFDRALEMARKADFSKSTNYQEHLWLGQMLNIIGRRAKVQKQSEEAEKLFADADKSFKRALELAPEVPSTWVAYVQFLFDNEKVAEAEKAVEEASQKIPPKQALLAIAQCYEVMKNDDAAEKKFEEALAAAPQDPLTVRTVADFYCRKEKLVPGETLLRQITEGKVPSSEADMIWARRTLALVYASRGGYQNFQKSRELIDQNLAVSPSSVLDQRVKAKLDALDPTKSRRDQAMQTLEAMLKDKAATPEDLFELARMYLRAGAWVKASGLYRNLIASYPNEPRFLAAYIEALLQHGETSNAELYLGRLEKNFPHHIITLGLRAEILTARNEIEQVIELLKSFIDNPNANPPEHDLRVRLVAEKFEQLAKKMTKSSQQPDAKRFLQQAEMLFRAYSDKNTGQEWVLVAFLGRQGRIDEALDLLSQNWDSVNPVVLSQVCSIILRNESLGKEQLQRLSRILKMAMKQHERPVPLLMVMADLSTKQGEYGQAEEYYQEVLKKNSDYASAMNNLAVLMALQGKNLEESMKLIEKAIEIAGPVAAMLDSRASVYMAMGDADKALADMNDALAEGETPVRFFHQAQAFEMAGQKNAAASAMKSALQLGLTKGDLLPLEFPVYDKLMRLAK